MNRSCLLLSASFFLLATAALAQGPSEPQRLLRAGQEAADADKSEEAVGLFTQAIAADGRAAQAYYLRGREQFRMGRVRESLADFDKLVELRPELESRQWERGIAAYYVGEYEKGAKQFTLYQTFHAADVENGAWRFLCQARASGVDKARADMLAIEGDSRVPMAEIYELYRGKRTPDDVFAATKRGTPTATELNSREFYAHLYVGLYYEATGAKELARKHLVLAEQRKIGHYMWDVAHVHVERLRDEEKK